jgi:hypothetical protein
MRVLSETERRIIIKADNLCSVKSDYSKQKKLSELGAIIRGVSYPSLEPMFQTKGASDVVRKPGPIEGEVKLKELGKMIRG